MSDLRAVLAAVLDASRTPEQRAASLRKLAPFLREEEAALGLAEGLRTEPSAALRRSMLLACLDVDATRIKKRKAWIEAFASVAALDPEPDLRLLAVRQLAALAAHEPEVEELLAATLDAELDESIQAAALEGLSHVARPGAATGKALGSYAARAPRELRPELAAALARLPRAAAEEGLLALLEPWEDPSLLATVLDAIGRLPDLTEAAARRVFRIAQSAPAEHSRARALAVLTSAKQVPAGVLEVVLELVAASPDRTHLVPAFAGKLSARPDVVARLAALAGRSTGMRMKLALLDLLAEAADPAPWIAALKDPSPWVRHRAVGGLLARHAAAPEAVGTALLEAAPGESVTELKVRIVDAVAALRGRGAKLDALLVAWLDKESDPVLSGRLAAAVATVPVTPENRSAILKAYRRILQEPFAADEARDAVMRRLRAFAYDDEPGLRDALAAVLERQREISDVEEVHTHLRRLEPDVAKLGGLLYTLFLRFLHHYPRDPLDGWVKDFHQLAKADDAFRARIPWIVRLTGATWILDAAPAADATSSFLESMKLALSGKGGYRGADRLLSEAWEKRTVRKSDIPPLFKLLLRTTEDGVLQRLVEICREGKLHAPELVDAAFGYLETFPTGRHAYQVKGYLEAVQEADPALGGRLAKALTPEGYAHYQRLHAHPKDGKLPIRTWNDWEYQGWRTQHPGWPILDLVPVVPPSELLLEALAAPPDPAIRSARTLQYAILEALWRAPSKSWGDYLKTPTDVRARELLAVATRFEGDEPAHAALRDRAAALFAARWKDYVDALKKETPPAELRRAASAAYALMCRAWAALPAKEGAEPWPKPMKHLDAARLEELWPLSKEAWEKLVREHLTTATPEQEAEAKRLLEEASALKLGFKHAEAHAVLARLLHELAGTDFIRSRRRNLEFELAKLDPEAASPADHEAKAEKLHETVARLSGEGENSTAANCLKDLLDRYWRTKFVRSRRADLLALWSKLRPG